MFTTMYLTNNISPFSRIEFSETNRRAIDEIWYRRAVEQHFNDPNSFVFSVPFDASNESLVTATHAVFHKESGKTTPAAVVGFQFQHTAMYALFKNITESTSDAISCASDDLECFIIDDNGYVIVSANYADIGKFFGEIRGFLMAHLINENVFRKIDIYDYQAICFVAKDPANIASRLLTVSEL